MQIMVMLRREGAPMRVLSGWVTRAVFLSMFAVAFTAIFYSGYAIGYWRKSDEVVVDEANARLRMQTEMLTTRERIDDMRRNVEGALKEVASRVGTLQARMTRLDAVAGRVVSVAGFAEDEFNLGEEPALGGPALLHGELDSAHALLSILSLDSDMNVREDQFSALEALLLDRELSSHIHPAGTPVDGGWISSRYGYRIDSESGEKEFHSGIDIAGRRGSPVRAVASGIVTWSGERYGYGNLVEISHGNGFVTRYAHNLDNDVVVGDRVEKDQVVARLGSTGRSSGPHVHFEVLKEGKSVNPSQFLQRKSG